MIKRAILVLIASLMCTLPAWAGNGHFLHGVLPTNSSMGGAGVAAATGPISAMHVNPALMTKLGYIRFETGTEFFKDDLSATSVDINGVSETAKSNGEMGVLPAVAWIVHPKGQKFAFGWSLMAVAGFRTNWAPDPNNLMLAPQPIGFGLLNTELAETKVTFSFAYDATSKLSLGLSAVLFQGRLAISPNPVVEPDISGGSSLATFKAYRPTVGGPVTKYGPAAQIGAFYEITPKIAFGASFTTPASFPKYVWNSTHANPNNPDFSLARKVDIKIDGPPIASFGFGITPNEKLKIAVDGRWVGYKNTQGIGKAPTEIYAGTGYEAGGGITPWNATAVGPSGPVPRFALISIGWKNIWIGMVGAEYKAHPKFTVRGGVNINQSPIQDRITLNSGGTPSTFNQHYCTGFSVKVTPNFSIDTGFYYTPKATKTGPFVPGQTTTLPTISLTDGIVSGLLGFSASF